MKLESPNSRLQSKAAYVGNLYECMCHMFHLPQRTSTFCWSVAPVQLMRSHSVDEKPHTHTHAHSGLQVGSGRMLQNVQTKH